MVWGGVSQHHRTGLFVIAGNLNAVSYREDHTSLMVSFLQAHPDMNLQHNNATSHTARSVRDFLLDRNVMFCDGQRRARISIPLSTSGIWWIAG